jgi:hypothetical protein
MPSGLLCFAIRAAAHSTDRADLSPHTWFRIFDHKAANASSLPFAKDTLPYIHSLQQDCFESSVSFMLVVWFEQPEYTKVVRMTHSRIYTIIWTASYKVKHSFNI